LAGLEIGLRPENDVTMSTRSIEHIDDILPAIEGRDDFVVSERPGYRVIDYVYALEDSFDHPDRIQCRGLKFDATGAILARPLHKFFNIGEKPDIQTHNLDLNRPHVIMEKLDGSMIHPAVLDNQLVLMTRMGVTETAQLASRHLTPKLEQVCRHWIETEGYTPVFEFTAPDNRIVVHYDQSRLTLLAMRHIITGTYLERDQVEDCARDMGLYAVDTIPSDWRDTGSFSEFVRVLEGREGFVVRFDDGLWVKAKSEDYVLRHKTRDQAGIEKNALAVILQNRLDDTLPLLVPDDQDRLLRYQVSVMTGLEMLAHEIEEVVKAGAAFDQKQFAVEHLADLPPRMRSLAFSVRAGRSAHEVVREFLSKHTATQTRLDQVRDLFKLDWPD
jgi:RNA ligase